MMSSCGCLTVAVGLWWLENQERGKKDREWALNEGKREIPALGCLTVAYY